jgi:hypothetical protein
MPYAVREAAELAGVESNKHFKGISMFFSAEELTNKLGVILKGIDQKILIKEASISYKHHKDYFVKHDFEDVLISNKYDRKGNHLNTVIECLSSPYTLELINEGEFSFKIAKIKRYYNIHIKMKGGFYDKEVIMGVDQFKMVQFTFNKPKVYK